MSSPARVSQRPHPDIPESTCCLGGPDATSTPALCRSSQHAPAPLQAELELEGGVTKKGERRGGSAAGRGWTPPQGPQQGPFAGTFPLRAGRWPIPPGLLGAVQREGWGSGRGWSWCPSSCSLQPQSPPESLGVGKAGVPPTGLLQFLSALITLCNSSPHPIPSPTHTPALDHGQTRANPSWGAVGAGLVWGVAGREE